MTSFPNSPRLMKGAIVGVDAMNPLATVLVFQYNLDTLTCMRDLMVPRCREAQVRKTTTARSVGRRTIELAGEACVNHVSSNP